MEALTFSFTGPLPWDKTLRERIAQTLTNDVGTARMFRDIRDGKRQVWTVMINDVESGTTVTEMVVHPDGTREAFIWAYQGREAVAFVQAFACIAHICKCTRVGFYTMHRAARRGFKCFSPAVSDTGMPGEMRFTFDTGKLINANGI